jgi:hypothetical protein
MIPALLVSSDVQPPVRRYLIATAGKKRIDFYNNGLFAGDSRLIGYRNPFARQEFSSITSDLCFLQRRKNTAGNGREIDALVTTSHLLFQYSPGAAGALLPISQPISTFLGRKALIEPRGGRGGSARRSHRKPRIDKLSRKFWAIGRTS